MKNNETEKIVSKNVSGTFRKWLGGIPYEISFWRSYYSNRRRKEDLFQWSYYGKECELDNFDMRGYVDSHSDNIVILDVGCALSYMLGTKSGNRQLDVTYVDPLAPFYNRLLDKYAPDMPRISFGMSETLTATFEEESVDFIHIRNSLDHSALPMEGIVQCLACLKPGGILYLNHFVNEALNEAYRGFHQYNINEKAGDLVIWNKDEEINVTKKLRGVSKVKTSLTESGRVVAVIEKTGKLPADLYDRHRSMAHSAEMMITTVEYFNGLDRSLGYQFKRLFTMVGHTTMRLLPYSILNKIKRFASKA